MRPFLGRSIPGLLMSLVASSVVFFVAVLGRSGMGFAAISVTAWRCFLARDGAAKREAQRQNNDDRDGRLERRLGLGWIEFRFFRNLCGRLATILSVRDELSPASVGSSQAPTVRRRRQLCTAKGDAPAWDCQDS